MFLTRAVSLLLDSAIAVLYPHACRVCGASVETRFDGIACRRCWQQVRFFGSEDLVCWKCGALAPSSIAGIKTSVARTAVRCRRCDHLAFSAARACGWYEGALRASVLELKREPNLCDRLLVQLKATLLQEPLKRASLIVSVPLHAEREKARGFNQAAVIAECLGSATRLRVNKNALVRVVHTERHRAGMDAKARHETVAAAFAVPLPEVIKGERVLLIDDVFTSGATASACAEALFSAGAADVMVLTLARPRY